MKLTLTREQAEANWGWSPKMGSLWPKEWPKKRRLRCTDRNIMSQQFLARRGTLIHTTAKSTCPRKGLQGGRENRTGWQVYLDAFGGGFIHR